MRLRVNQPGEHITSFLFHSGDEQWYQVSGMWQQQATLCSYAMIVISAILLLQSGFRLHDQSEFQLRISTYHVCVQGVYSNIKQSQAKQDTSKFGDVYPASHSHKDEGERGKACTEMTVLLQSQM